MRCFFSLKDDKLLNSHHFVLEQSLFCQIFILVDAVYQNVTGTEGAAWYTALSITSIIVWQGNHSSIVSSLLTSASLSVQCQ